MPALLAVPVQGAAEVDVLSLVLTIVLLIFSLGFHEAAHAWTALRCGDPTGRDLGRITLNPIPHIDPIMSIVVPTISYLSTGFIFGGAKPVPVNFHRLRNPLRDMSLVALAGPASNLLLAVLFLLLAHFFETTGFYNGANPISYLRYEDRLPSLMAGAAIFNVLLAVFNLVPIPPLDGSRVMSWLLPSSVRPAYDGLERFGLLILIALMFLSPGFNLYLRRTIVWVAGLLEQLVTLGGVW